MVDWEFKEKYGLNDFIRIIDVLRGPGGCPWDIKQTHESLKRNAVEEAYEVCGAIDEGSMDHLREELGDLLIQVIFHASIARENGGFDLDDISDEAVKKLIHRHPHVFGTVKADTPQEVLANWEELKKAEKGQSTQADAVDAVARSLPALWRAEKVQKKAAQAGFDWPDLAGAMDKLSEETRELQAAVAGQGDPVEELGDLLFAAVKVARFLHADPENVLQAATDKFSARFRLVEQKVLASGRRMDELSLLELDELWQQAKHSAPET